MYNDATQHQVPLLLKTGTGWRSSLGEKEGISVMLSTIKILKIKFYSKNLIKYKYYLKK